MVNEGIAFCTETITGGVAWFIVTEEEREALLDRFLLTRRQIHSLGQRQAREKDMTDEGTEDGNLQRVREACQGVGEAVARTREILSPLLSSDVKHFVAQGVH